MLQNGCYDWFWRPNPRWQWYLHKTLQPVGFQVSMLQTFPLDGPWLQALFEVESLRVYTTNVISEALIWALIIFMLFFRSIFTNYAGFKRKSEDGQMVKLTRRNSIKPKKNKLPPDFSHVETTIAQGCSPGGSQQKGGISMEKMTFPRDQRTWLPTHVSTFWSSLSPFLFRQVLPDLFFGKHQWSSWKLNLTLRYHVWKWPKKTLSTISPPQKNNASNHLTLPCCLFFSVPTPTAPRSFFSFISKTP